MKKRKISYIYCIIAAVFILGTYRGRVALWDGNDPSKPIAVFETPVTLLPPADQLALENGIYAENQESLTKLLEDYLS